MSQSLKLTLAGIGGAILQGGAELLTSGDLNWKNYLSMAMTAAIGFFAKTYTSK